MFKKFLSAFFCSIILLSSLVALGCGGGGGGGSSSSSKGSNNPLASNEVDIDYYYQLSSVDSNFVKQWVLKTINGKPVKMNSNKTKGGMTLEDDGKFSSVIYTDTEYDDYFQINDEVEEKMQGKWSYYNGYLFFNDYYTNDLYCSEASLEPGNILVMIDDENRVFRFKEYTMGDLIEQFAGGN